MSGSLPLGASTAPDAATFRVLADYQGFTALSDSRLANAAAAHAAMRADLLGLRAKPMPFLAEVPEPAEALAWLERGGDRT